MTLDKETRLEDDSNPQREPCSIKIHLLT